MQTIITQGFTLEQLLEAMRPVIRHEVNQVKSTASLAPATEEELLTVRQAATLLDVCVATIHEWKRRGLLAYQKVGGRTYFRRSDILAVGTQHRRATKPARAKGG
jgi:excisionase family DNA binding protein